MKPELFNRKALLLLRERFGRQGWWESESPLEVAFGAILAQRTVWKNAEKSVNALKAHGLLNPQKILESSVEEIAPLIRHSGFPKSKAQKLKNFSEFIVKELGGNLQNLKKLPLEEAREKLLQVKGVGFETADSILCYALKMPVLVVDAYTFRIFHRHQLVDENVNYNELQEIASRGLPHDCETLAEYHALLVKTAKDYCRKKQPLCRGEKNCPLEELLP